MNTPPQNNFGQQGQNPLGAPPPSSQNQMQTPPPTNLTQYNAPNSQQIGASNEELIEAIIDEKWNDLLKDINKIIEWKNQAEQRITSLEQEIKDMKGQFDSLHQAIVGKINDYDKHILDVGAEIKAMEKVFSKVLPVFTENVSELTRITDDMKAMKK